MSSPTYHSYLDDNEKKDSSSNYHYTDTEFASEEQNGFHSEEEEHTMWRRNNDKKNKKDEIEEEKKIKRVGREVDANSNVAFKRKSRTNTFNSALTSPYSLPSSDDFKATKSHSSYSTVASSNPTAHLNGKLLKFEGTINTCVAKGKEIVLFHKLEDKCYVVSLSPMETREQFVKNIIDHFQCYPPYYPSHLTVNGTALSLEPRWLYHEVEEGYTYELGFFLMPFDKVEQKAKFEPEALLLLQNYIIEKGCQYMREGNLRDTVVTKDDMQKIIHDERHKSVDSYPSFRLAKYFSVVDSTVAEFLKLVRGNEWEFIKSKEGVKIYRGSQERVKSSCNCMMGVGLIKANPKLVKDILIDPSANKRKYNNLLQTVKDIEVIDKRTRIVYLKYISKKWGISFLEKACDMVILYHWYQEKDGTFVIAGKSIEHEDVPELYDCKRAFVYSSGYEIKQYRSENGEVYSKVTYISHVNLGMNLPQFLVKIVEESQPLIISHLNQYIQSFLKTPHPK